MSIIYLFIQSWKYAGADRPKLIVHGILHVLSFCGRIALPYVFGRMIHELQHSSPDGVAAMVRWGGGYLALFLGAELLHHTGRYFEISTALRTMQRFLDHMYAKVSRLPFKWHTDNHTGDTVDRIDRAAEALVDFGVVHNEYLGHICMSVGPLCALALLSPKITVLTVCMLLLIALVVWRLSTLIYPILRKQNETWHAFSARLFDYVSNIRTIISLRLGARTRAELSSLFDGTREEEMAEFKLNQPRCFILNFGVILTEVVVILTYIFSTRARGETVMIGAVVTIFGYFRQISQAFSDIANSFYDTLHWRAALQSVARIESAEEYGPVGHISEQHAWETATVLHLTHSFGETRSAVKDLTLTFSRGQSIALVGPSGCGKSTLLSLLRGLYPPDRGKLILDSHPVSFAQIAGRTTLIPQDPEIFNDSIRFNLTCGISCDDDILYEVMDIACFTPVLERMPGGLDTDTRERGLNLSGGEKQRLALARGLLAARSSSVLLLDEPTSSVDEQTESIIFRRILAAYRDKCIICSVHRLHLLKLFDRVIALTAQGAEKSKLPSSSRIPNGRCAQG